MNSIRVKVDKLSKNKVVNMLNFKGLHTRPTGVGDPITMRIRVSIKAALSDAK